MQTFFLHEQFDLINLVQRVIDLQKECVKIVKMNVFFLLLIGFCPCIFAIKMVTNIVALR